MTRHPFRSTLFILVLYAVTSLWTGTAEADTCNPQSASQSAAQGVKYYDCRGKDPSVHVVTIDRSLAGWRMHILAHPTSTWDTFILRKVDTLAIENDALVAINGFAWRGDEGLCCSSNPTGIPDSTLYLWGQQRTSFSGTEALMGFSGLQPKLLNKDSTVDQSAYPANLTYRQSLYGSNRSILNDLVLDENGTIQKGYCRPDSTELPETYSAIGYSDSQIILLTAEHEYRPDQLCNTFKAFGANYAVLNDGGSAAELYVGGNLKYFIDPNLKSRYVAYAIGLVPAGAQGNVMNPNDMLIPGQSIFSSNGLYQLIYQYDGNLVLYRRSDGHPLWASNTYGQATRVAIMQTDGNLVVYDRNNALWASGTCCNSGFRLRLRDDGNVVIERPSDGYVLWQTNTVQPPSGTCPTDGTLIPPYSYSGNKAHINLFTNAPARSDTDKGCRQVGQSYSSTNPQYIWCRRWGGEVRDSSNNYNHWWLWTDLDTGGSGWISAYYIQGQGNDQANDMNTGQPIELCQYAPN